MKTALFITLALYATGAHAQNSIIVDGIVGGENTPTDSTSTVNWQRYMLSQKCQAGWVWNTQKNACVTQNTNPPYDPTPPSIDETSTNTEEYATPPQETIPTGNNAEACLMVMAPSGRTMSASGMGTIDAGTCNIIVNSTSNCAVTLSGGVDVIGYNVTLGQNSLDGCNDPASGLIASNTLTLESPPTSDPYAERVMPKPSQTCMPIPPASQQNVRMNPGTYCQNVSFNGVTEGTQSITLNPGVYIFAGSNLALGGNLNLTGNGVTLVFADNGGLSTNGTVALNLTPTTSGQTAGIAIWYDRKSNGRVAYNGSTTLKISGTIYAPNAQFTWGGQMRNSCVKMIVGTIDFAGSAQFKNNCS